jgi:hypothetical protein
MICNVSGLSKTNCVICDRDTDCFEADFAKLKGHFCRACFSKLVKIRSSKKDAARKEEPSPALHGQPALPLK